MDDEEARTIGEQVRRIRKVRRKSQEVVAGLAGMSAASLNPELLPSAGRQAVYWADYGRALARLRGRRDDAVRALRTAELISPARVQRHPVHPRGTRRTARTVTPGRGRPGIARDGLPGRPARLTPSGRPSGAQGRVGCRDVPG
ncbi:MAG: hypothetical protein ACT4NY_30545 [Pseudonocardiales bacterium]